MRLYTSLAACALFLGAGHALADELIEFKFSINNRLANGTLPLRDMRVLLFEDDDGDNTTTFGDDLFFTGFTSVLGTAFNVVEPGDDFSIFGTDYEVFAQFASQRRTGTRVADGSYAGNNFVLNTGLVTGIGDNNTTTTITVTPIDNTSRAEKSLHTLMTVGFFEDYYNQLLAGTRDPVTVAIVNNPASGSIAFYTNASDGITISDNNWSTWDVIGHEYGHHVAQEMGIDASPGGAHFITSSVLRVRPPAMAAGPNQGGLATLPGLQLAWSEGIATTLSQIATNERANAVFPNLPAADKDTDYDVYISSNPTVSATMAPDFQFRHSMESLSFTNQGGQFNTMGQGEGNELSVMRALWDFYDNTPGETFASGMTDTISLGASNMMDDLLGQDGSGVKPQTFDAFWRNVWKEAGQAGSALRTSSGAVNQNHAMALAGAILQENGISSVPTGETITLDTTGGGNSSITFNITEQNDDVSNFFNVAVFDTAWNFLFMRANDVNDPNHVAPVAGMVTTGITEAFAIGVTGVDGLLVVGRQYHWVALNDPLNVAPLDSIDDYYWSSHRSFTFIPAPGTVVLLALTGIVGLRRRR